MSELNKAIEQLIKVEGYDWKKIASSTHYYIEVLSISNSEEIKDMIRFVYENYYMECPLWAKLIAFRILILQNPDDVEIKQWVKADLEMFYGIGWQEILNKM